MSGLSGFSASFAITASALTAEKLRMDVISNNIANADTTRTIQGGPYIRERVVFAPRVDTTNGFGPMFASSMGAMDSSSPMFDSMTPQESQDMPMGVRVTGIIKDPSPPRMVYDPG
ncbi:MAG: flagellar basal body protein, partial [bacterium]